MKDKKTKPKITFSVISAIPEVITAYGTASILGRAQKSGVIAINGVSLRDFAEPPHHRIDDQPFGGGPGMVLKVEPIAKALKSLVPRASKTTRTILLSTRGTVFNQQEAERLKEYKHLIFITGRYEGVDERVAEHLVDEEMSIGDMVLTGGELPALIAIDTIARLIPGVLGKHESLESINGSFPTYTRPASFRPGKSKETWDVPEALVSGNHAHIAQWRRQYGLGTTL